MIEILKLIKYKVIDKECKERVVHYNNLKIVKGDSNWNYTFQEKGSEDESLTNSDRVVSRYSFRPR